MGRRYEPLMDSYLFGLKVAYKNNASEKNNFMGRTEHQQKCPVCGEMFSIRCKTEEHYWRIEDKKYHTVPVCSYKCMRTWEKAQAKKGETDEQRRQED